MFCREQHEVKLFFSRFRQLLLKDLLTGLEDKPFQKLVSVLTSPTYKEFKNSDNNNCTAQHLYKI